MPEHSSPPPLHNWQDAYDFNQPLDWDVAQVTSMYRMFLVRPGRSPIAPPHASLPPCLQPAAAAPHARLSLPRLPLRTWQFAYDFNQPLDWDVAQVTSMEYMFYVRPGRCPIAPSLASLPPCLQPAASAPHALA
jgi:hypothetical protein